MADISITPASVISGANASVLDGTAGETITAGQAVYKSTTTGKMMKADCNSATAEARTPWGLALNGASLDQPVRIQRSGSITLGAVLTAGIAYYLSGTAGGIRPVADNTTGDYPCVLGIAASTSVLNLGINPAGVAL